MREASVGRARRTSPLVLAVAMSAAVGLAGCAEQAPDATTGAGTAPAPTTPAASGQTPDGAAPQTPPDPETDPDMDPETTGATDATEPPAGTDPGAGTAVLTEQDAGAQVALVVGQERPLRLGNGWSWSEPVVDGDAVTLTPVDYLVDPGYVEWIVTGVGEGTAVLEVVGEPVCGDADVCPPTTVALDVEVTG